MPNDFEEIDRYLSCSWGLPAQARPPALHVPLRPEDKLPRTFGLVAGGEGPWHRRRVVHLDCGTFALLISKEVASERPQTQFYAVDIAPLQPEKILPKNIVYTCANILKGTFVVWCIGLPYADKTFDYVHARLMMGAVPRDAWPKLIAEYMRVLKPGGYLEITEPEGIHLPAGPCMEAINSLLVQLLLTRGIDVLMMSKLEGHLTKAGFADVEKTTLKLPCGKWGGKLGELQMDNIKHIFEALSGMMIVKGLTTKDKVDAIVNGWDEELDDLRISAFVYYYVARKPQ
jgi:SAM-dependent methyltransferase